MPMTLTEKQIRDSLPVPPFRYKYVVTQQSPQIWRVDLLHPMVYTYTTDQVKTIWGFIKGGKVYPPKNSQKPARSPLCDLSEVPDECDYTTIIPTTRILHG